MRHSDSRGRLLSTLLHMVVWASALACGPRSGDGAAADPENASFRVALLTPGPISDQSWNAGAYRGLQRIRDSLGAQVSHIQTRTPAEFEENFRQYGAQEYDLVFGHGFEFQDAAVRVAPEYPRSVYVTTSGTTTGANVAGMEFAFEDASYLAGMVAGAVTKTNVLGVIGGTELPPVRSSFYAFEQGARAVNPRVRVLTSYVGNWDDIGAGKEQALAQIGRGADVIFQNADAAGLGVFQAARESTARGVRVFGSNSDQNGVAPDVVLGSVVIDLPHAFLSVAREVKEQRFTPRVISLGTKDDVVRLVMNPALESTVPATARSAVDSVRALLAAGKFAAPRAPRAPRAATAAASAR
jgi:basic membrane lipoprotein Med (substrate-binding protein (PBP1-ABC) superfamily)